jgi:hypothetical protein
MGENQKRRKQIEGLERVIVEHEKKIAKEMEKYEPNQTLIAVWKKHIHKAQTNIHKKQKRLP